MFQKSTSGSSSSSQQATVIARGVTLEGNFQAQGDVVVEGRVKGSLSTTGALTVGTEAVIEAEVKAADASVAGTIQGNVTVSNRLELRPTAKIVGDVSTQVIAIEAGASLQGRLSVAAPKVAEGKRSGSADRSALHAAA